MNKPEYSAYPEEKEFLIMDGADYIVEDVTEMTVNHEIQKEAHKDLDKYFVITMSQINNWEDDDHQFVN